MAKPKKSDQETPQADNATFGEEAQVASDVALNTLSKQNDNDIKQAARKVVVAFKKEGEEVFDSYDDEEETTEEGLSEKEFQNELIEILLQGTDFKGHKVKRVSTFEEAGIMTRNKGVIVRLDDNTKFQIEIVKDRRGY